METNWREKMAKEFDAKEADFLARQPKPKVTEKAPEEPARTRDGDAAIENKIRMLMGYSNVETAREKEIEFDVKNRMLRDGWEAGGSVSLTLESDLMELLAGELDNDDCRMVILPKEKRSLIFRRRKRG